MIRYLTIFLQNNVLLQFFQRKHINQLSTIRFTSDDILKVIKNFDPNKAHDHDMRRIRMIKICDASICKPSKIISRSCLENGKFPTEWKKANVIPAHKKGDKQNLKNYRPISLLPVAGKIFERTLYNNKYEFFTENNLISPDQSGFKPGDSCIDHFLPITHEIYKSFDDGFEVRGIFLDISKAFVWHLQGIAPGALAQTKTKWYFKKTI